VAPQGFSTFFSPSDFNLSVSLTNRIADGRHSTPKSKTFSCTKIYLLFNASSPHLQTETQYKYWLDVQLVHLCQSLWRISK
jgi:hypothetical protein